MFVFWKRRQYKNGVLGCLYALLYWYPRGRDKITKDYPGIAAAIKSNFEQGASQQCAAIFIATFVLTDLIESLSREQRTLIAQQLGHLDVRRTKVLLADIMAGRPLPPEIAMGTILFANARMMARTLLDDKEIEQSDYEMLDSEICGALAGMSSDQRSSERISNVFDTIAPLKEIREGDSGPLLPRLPNPTSPPLLSGTETEVRLATTVTGIALFNVEDGRQITERRALTQDVLRKVPMEMNSYRFVNLRARSGEVYSCIIAGEDTEVFGDMRAFWWALARVNVINIDRAVRMTRMTPAALARVHAAAREMWDTATKEAHSIENMRDLIMPLRNVHFEVITKLKSASQSESERLGLDIALAMVLATQSEDAKLEAFAYNCFKNFLWQQGEEPPEFYEHEAA